MCFIISLSLGLSLLIFIIRQCWCWHKKAGKDKMQGK